MYNSYFHKLNEEIVKDFSFNLTFLMQDGRVYVKHNKEQAIPYTTLFGTDTRMFPELREMCGIVFDYIEQRYQSSPLMQKWKREGKPWQMILHRWLLKYFSKWNGELTIQISEDGRGKNEVGFVTEAEKEETENKPFHAPPWL